MSSACRCSFATKCEPGITEFASVRRQSKTVAKLGDASSITTVQCGPALIFLNVDLDQLARERVRVNSTPWPLDLQCVGPRNGQR